MSHADLMFQRNNIIHTYDNRNTFINQIHHFTCQRTGNSELEIPLLSLMVVGLQYSNTYNANNNTPPPDNGDPETEIGYAEI